MVQTGRTFTYNDESKKMTILTRLVKEGHITLDEAFELADQPNRTNLGPVVQPTINIPYYPDHSRRMIPNIQEPWYRINDPNKTQITYFSNPSCNL